MEICKVAGLLALLFFLKPLTTNAQEGERNYELSTEKSKITWKGQRGDEPFSGKLKIREGYIQLKDDDLTQTVVFADMGSIDCKSCGDQETSEDIMIYARSKRFLNVDVMSFATFKMFKSEKYKGEDDYDYQIEGQLTIIGYSQTITIPVSVKEKKGKIYAQGDFTLNRALWNLNNPTIENPELYMDQTIMLNIYLEGDL